MSKKNIKGRVKKVLIPITVFVGIILIWEAIVTLTKYPTYLLPRPSLIFTQLISNFYSLLYHTGITLSEAVIGFLIANSLAFILAVAFAHSETVKTGLYPFVIKLLLPISSG